MEEKLELLTHARDELAQSFKALSADALRMNSQSFLELAQLQLSRFQEGARADLTQRERSIEELVKAPTSRPWVTRPTGSSSPPLRSSW